MPILRRESDVRIVQECKDNKSRLSRRVQYNGGNRDGIRQTGREQKESRQHWRKGLHNLHVFYREADFEEYLPFANASGYKVPRVDFERHMRKHVRVVD